MRNILNRYIVTELLIPFSLSLGVITFIMLLTKLFNIGDLIFDKGVGFWPVANVIVSIFLYLTGISIPLSFLLGILMAFGRLASDNEIIALRTSGISIFQILLPVFGLSFVVYILSFFLYVSVIPRADWNATKAIRALEKNATALIEEKVWMEGFGNSSIYVNRIYDGNKFRNIAIHQLIPDNILPRVIIAENGEYVLDEVKKQILFSLKNGHIDEPSAKEKNKYQRIDFGFYQVSLPVNQKMFSAPKKRVYHLTYMELNKKIRETPQDQIDYRSLVFEKHIRLVMSSASIVFLLLGIPISINLSRPDKSTNFAVAAGLALSWYLLMLTGRGLALHADLPIAFGTWLPNIVMGAIGLGLTVRAIIK